MASARSCTACFTPNPFTVAAGIKTSLSFSNITPTFDFSADKLVVSFTQNVGLVAGSFVGPIFTVLAGNPFPAIVSVTGMPASDAIETGDKLELNWQSLTFNNGDQVVVNFAADTLATPLPAALPLFATCLGALGLLTGASPQACRDATVSGVFSGVWRTNAKTAQTGSQIAYCRCPAAYIRRLTASGVNGPPRSVVNTKGDAGS